MKLLPDRSLALLLVGLAACSSPSPSSSGAESVPGWKAISPAPPRTLGTLSLRQQGSTLEGTLSTQEGDEPSGTLMLFVRWDGAPEEKWIGSMSARDGEQIHGVVESPPCEAATPPKGTLLVRSEGTLVGVSNLDRTLFRAPFAMSFQIEPACPGRATPNGPLPPMSLSMDPRLPLALCPSTETGPVRCGVEVLPEVRVASASAAIESEGSVLLSFSPVYAPPSETPELWINGERVELVAPGVWQARLASRTAPPLREGDNDIVWSIGERPPWRARLELPRNELRPRSGSLRVGQPFVVDIERAAWAHRYDVSVSALVTPPLKSSFFFSSPEPRVEGTFEGFDHSARATGSIAAAQLLTTARGGGRGFEIARSEIVEVRVQ